MSNSPAHPLPYRAMSLADLALHLRTAGVEERWRLIAEFLEEFRWEPPVERLGLLEAEPLPTGDERWDVFLAALAEYVAFGDDRAGPAWGERRSLRAFWFPFDSPAAKADALVHAPASFRRRGVLVARQELGVA